MIGYRLNLFQLKKIKLNHTCLSIQFPLALFCSYRDSLVGITNFYKRGESMNRTIQSALQYAVQKHPEKVFLYEGDLSVTFRELDQITNRLARSLLEIGLKKGDHIGVLALNQIEWLLTFFAATKIGVGVVALSPRFRERELTYMLNHSEAKAVVSISQFSDFSFSELLQQLKPKLKTVENYIFIGEGFEGSLSFQKLIDSQKDSTTLVESQQINEDDLAIMIYTSGTTGNPKGVMITNGSILAAAKHQKDHFKVTPDDVLIGNIPLNHVGGITCTIMVALLTGSSVALIPFFDPGLVLSTIEKHKVTIIGAVPTMYIMMLNHEKFSEVNLDSLRLAIVGGSNLEPELAAQISTYIPNAKLVNLYGLSESSGAIVLSNLTDDLEKVQNTLGVPIGDVQVKIVDRDRNPLPVGETGELAIKSSCVAKGYYQDEQKSKETFTSDGWLYTGDIVTLHEDGYLSYKGRLQEMFIQGGFNVYPIEVENVLTKHPKIQMAAGFGVPDKFLGEIGRYYIVPKPNQTITKDEVIKFCQQYLADYKIPRQIEIVEDLPLTPAGKIHKSLLKSQYLNQMETKQNY